MAKVVYSLMGQLRSQGQCSPLYYKQKPLFVEPSPKHRLLGRMPFLNIEYNLSHTHAHFYTYKVVSNLLPATNTFTKTASFQYFAAFASLLLR